MKKELLLTPVNQESDKVIFQIKKTLIASFTGNTILFATDSNQKEVVVKLIPDIDKANREWLGLVHAYLTTNPVPEPLIFGVTEDKIAGIVSRKIAGRLLSDNRDPQKRFVLGNIINHLHTCPSIDVINRDYAYYEKSHRNWERNGLNLVGLFASLSNAMSQYCEQARSVFCHGDLHDGQVIDSPTNLIIIDFEKWRTDRPLHDVGMYLFHCLRTGVDIRSFKCFIDGYNGNILSTENNKLTLMYYLLFISTGALVHFQQANNWYLEQAKQNQEKVLSFIKNETVWKL